MVAWANWTQLPWHQIPHPVFFTTPDSTIPHTISNLILISPFGSTAPLCLATQALRLLHHPHLNALALQSDLPLNWNDPSEVRARLHIPYLRCSSDSPLLTSQGPDSSVEPPRLSALAPTYLSVFAPTAFPEHPFSAPDLHGLPFLNQHDLRLCSLSYSTLNSLSSFVWVMNICLFFCQGSGSRNPFLFLSGLTLCLLWTPPQPGPLSPASAAR